MGFKYKVNNINRAYSITISVVEQIELFRYDRFRSLIIEALKFCIERNKFKIYGWCLMSNSLHLIGQSKDLSGAIRDLKTYTSKAILKLILEEDFPEKELALKHFKKAGAKNRKGIEYKVWGDGFYPVELYSPGFAYQKLFEIHGYPLQAGLVFEKSDYLYSSARNYSNMDGLIDVSNIDEVIHSLRLDGTFCPARNKVS
jgi:putative transposase